MIFESLKDNPQMIHMLFHIPRVNEVIVNKSNNKQVKIPLEHVAHQIHERCRRIGSRNDITTSS